MIKRQATIVLFAVATGLLLTGCDNKSQKNKTQAAIDPVPLLQKDAAALERGKAICVGTCGAYCHKMTEVPSDAPYLFDCTWLHGDSDQEIFNTISHGVSKTRMVPFAGALPDEDIWKIVAYLKSEAKCPK